MFVLKFSKILHSFEPFNYREFSTYKKFLFWSIVFAVLLSTFLTVLGQIPVFVSTNIHSIFNLGWVLAGILLFLFDYKFFVRCICTIIPLVIPPIVYTIILALVQGRALISETTRTLLLCLIPFACGLSFSFYSNKTFIKTFCISYILASIAVGLVIYFKYLSNVDLSNQVYSYSSKNSTGIVLLIASIFAIYLASSSRALFIKVISGILSVAFFLLVVLMKCRAGIVATLPLFFYLAYKRSKRVFYISIIAIFLLAIVVVCVEPLRTTIIENILFNGKTDIDSISSGRFSIIFDYLSKTNVMIGYGDVYIDCMPINLYCNYGLLGLLLLAPYALFPFLIIIRYSQKMDESSSLLFCSLAILLIVNSIFEAYGYFGPGTKVFTFWFLVGINSRFSLKDPAFTKPNNILNDRIEIIKPDHCSIAGAVALSFASLLLIIPSIYSSAATKISAYVPSPDYSVDYIAPESLNVLGPSVVCVGQKLTFTAEVSPVNVTDAGVGWSSWDERILKIDYATGSASPVAAGGVNIVANSLKVENVMTTKLIRVVTPDQYSFDNLSITCGADRPLLIGDTAALHYSREYVPNNVDISFHSSDCAVATVDENGIVKGQGPGECKMWAEIINSKGTFVSNYVEVEVASRHSIAVDSIQIDVSSAELYTNVPISFDTVFNDGVTDKELLYEFDPLRVSVVDSSLVFHKSGTTTIKFTSQNNLDCSVSKTFDVSENPIVAFECANDSWQLYGNKIDLEVFAIFQNGYRRAACVSDLYLKRHNYSIRAWHGKSGLVDNYFRVLGVKTGTLNVRFTSVDRKISNVFSFTISHESRESSAGTHNNYVLLMLFAVSALSCMLISCQRFSNAAKSQRFITIGSLLMSSISYGVVSFMVPYWPLVKIIISICFVVLILLTGINTVVLKYEGRLFAECTSVNEMISASMNYQLFTEINV